MKKKSPDSPAYFFCGIGGNGMSPLARLLRARGTTVFGSDRSFDLGTNLAFFERLAGEGIHLVPQDGSGVTGQSGQFVVTRAVEATIPDVKKAKELGLPIVRRPELMAALFATTKNVAVGGTSGKSTTTAMIGFILERLGRDPTIVDGAEMINFGSHFRNGRSALAVFEADESDGLHDVIAVCPADVAVLTNISLDHFELDELAGIFEQFIARAALGAVLNADCATSMKLRNKVKNIVTFGLGATADIHPGNVNLCLSIPGKHNEANALAAMAAVSLLGVKPDEAARILKDFKGIRRRLELVGQVNEIAVYDDFASNPGKISATVRTLREKYSRIIAVFQPHGFQPTKMMKDGYIETFSTELRADDLLVMPPIYYVGGSANMVAGKLIELPKDISSLDVIAAVALRRGNSFGVASRAAVLDFILENVQAGDAVVVMGSRDETLPNFARSIVERVRDRK